MQGGAWGEKSDGAGSSRGLATRWVQGVGNQVGVGAKGKRGALQLILI